jgi:5'-nucleotidase
MPRILVSNDDGVDSPGLHALTRAMEEVGEVTVVAPDRERSAASHALTLHKPLRVEKIRERVFSVNGTPTDCVTLGVNLILAGIRPDLVVSGINKGANLGDDVTYSGTVSAAFEGTLLKIPSFAVSLVAEKDFLFETASRAAILLARQILQEGLPQGVLLNVNVPNIPWEEVTGIRITRQGKRIYDESTIVEKTDPRGKKYYWIGGGRLSWERGLGPDSDFDAVEAGGISVTPLRLDLTDEAAIVPLKKWEGLLSE